jgi:hypothetical protein
VASQPMSAPPPPAAAQPQTQWNTGEHDAWQVKLPNGEVRSGTRPQLEEAFRAGHLGEGALVLAAGAREWVTLGSVMGLDRPAPAAVVSSPEPVSARAPQPVFAAPEPMQSAPQWTDGDSEVWQVRLTRPQLENAVRDGYLDDDSLVLAAGASEWVRLGTVVARPEPKYAPEARTEPSARTDLDATPVPTPSSEPAAGSPAAPMSSPSPLPEAQAALAQRSAGDDEPPSGEVAAPGHEPIEQTFQSERFGE